MPSPISSPSREVALWAAGRARRTTLAVERQKVEEELRSGSRSLIAATAGGGFR